MSNPTYDLSKSGCKGTSAATLRAIQDKVHADGVLRNGRQIVRSDRRFVTAELHLRTDDKHHKGQLLTWVTTGPSDSEFHSVDVSARDYSSWPAADIDVRADGARESRACATTDLGKTKAQVECERETNNNSGVPAAGGRDCGEL